MIDFIEKLGNIYFLEMSTESSQLSKDVLSELIEKQKRVRDGLENEQRKHFDEYCEKVNELCGIYEREAFIKGLRFATQYLIFMTV